MKRVYVAGKFSGNNVLDVLKNIGKGKFACTKMFSLGLDPFCPWADMDYVIFNPDGDFNVERFYQYSISWLKVSEILYILSGWRESKGAMIEISIAKKLNIPIYYQDDISIEDFAKEVLNERIR